MDDRIFINSCVIKAMCHSDGEVFEENTGVLGIGVGELKVWLLRWMSILYCRRRDRLSSTHVCEINGKM